MTIVTDNKTPRLNEVIKKISNADGSPCPICIVVATCRKSFVDGSACRQFAEFIQDKMIKAGMLKED